MNITGSLVELPRWSDYYVPEAVSDDFTTQDMNEVQQAQVPMPQETAWIFKVRGTKLLEKALRNRDIKALYDQASDTPSEGNKLGPWKITFERDREFLASCNAIDRKIIIDANCSDDKALDCFVFELINAIVTKKYFKFEEKARKGQIECETYVLKVERQEFKNAILHSKIMRNAIQEMGWSNSLDNYGNYHEELRKIVEQSNNGLKLELKDLHGKMFALHWFLAKNTPHANYYRKQWKELAPISTQIDNFLTKTSTRIGIAIAIGSCLVLQKITRK